MKENFTSDTLVIISEYYFSFQIMLLNSTLYITKHSIEDLEDVPAICYMDATGHADLLLVN